MTEVKERKDLQYRNLQPVSYNLIDADRVVQEQLKKRETKEITRDYVQNMADWNTWITGSFVGGKTSLYTAQARHDKFIRQHLEDATHFTAFELHNNGVGWHFHSLMHLPGHLLNKFSSNNRSKYGKDKYVPRLWKLYFDAFGRTSISRVRVLEDVTDYCIKHVLDYTTKGDVRGLGVYDFKFGNSEDGQAFLKRQDL